ncbi:MAG: ATP-binding protein [Anaerolineae bacterium]|nr:ATP-binding protein [Anaerolineae bacterium]
MSIRTRLTFLYASLLAIAMLLFSTATLSVLNWTMRRQVDETLLKAANDVHLEAVLGAIPATLQNPLLSELTRMRINSPDSPGLYVQIWLRDSASDRVILYDYSWSLLGIGLTGPLDSWALSNAQRLRRDVTVNGHHLRVVTVPLEINGELRGAIQTGQSLRTIDAAIDRLLKIMLIGGALTMLAALLIGDYLTRRALRPIDTIAQTARQITAADDLSRRIPYDGPPDELGQLTQTFNETLTRLERLFNVQRRFVADVSHEMRTPLTTIRGNVDLMRRFGYDEEATAAIDSEARRMSRLVEDLLLLAKADAGRLPLERQLVELDTIVVEVFNQARMLSDTVTVVLGPVEPACVIGDPDRIKQLLLNLASNGLKYTPEGGTVTLGLRRDGEWVDVSVTDTGVGIPAEDLPHIFDRFYRVDKARSRVQGGTGLGLSIAKWLVEAHGGQIAVTSEPGSGSTFTIRLPLAADQKQRVSVRNTTPHPRPVRLPRAR